MIFSLIFLLSPPPPTIPIPKVPTPVSPSQEDLEDLLVRQLSDEDPKVRKHAADVLAKLGPQAGFAVPELWHTYRQERFKVQEMEENVRLGCRYALMEIGPPAVSVLVKSLDKKEPELDREEAARILASIARKHGSESIKDAIPSLTAAAKEPSRIRTAAILALSSAGKTAIDALPTLERLFERTEGEKRLQVALCLVRISGPDHPQAEPYFKQLDKDLSMIDAAKRDDLDNVRRWIKDGADVNATYKGALFGHPGAPGRTALIYASFNGNEDMVKLLLASGAKLDYSLDGKTALDFAKNEAVRTLLKQSKK